MKDVTNALVNMLVSTRYEDLSAQTIDTVRRSTLDIMGCMLAGSSVPECETLVRTFTKLGSASGAHIVGRSSRMAAPWAAFVNATAGRALDMDDLYEPGQLHATVAVVPVLLALADVSDRLMSGREFIATVATAIDLLGRLSVAPRQDSNITGISHTYHFGTFAAAAAAARALGCDQNGVRNALGLALGMAGGTRQPNLEGVASIRVQQGWAAHSGLMAGLLATQGLQGPEAVFEGRFGYFNVYHPGGWDAGQLVDDLGKRFAVDALTIKFYPACKYAHGAIEAISNIQRRRPFQIGEVQRVRVRVPEISFSAVCQPEQAKRTPTTVPEAQFSLPYLAAATLVRGRMTVAELEPSAIMSDDLRFWSKRVEIERDDSLAKVPDALSAAAVEIELTSGERLSETVLGTVGDPQRPCDFARVVEKVDNLLTASGESVRAKLPAIVDILTSLESVSDMRVLGGLLEVS